MTMNENSAITKVSFVIGNVSDLDATPLRKGSPKFISRRARTTEMPVINKDSDRN